MHHPSTEELAPNSFTHNVLSLTRDAVIITDVKRKILFASHTVEHMFGYQPSSLLDQPLDILLLKEDLTYYVPNMYKITLERGLFQGEILLVSKTGESLYTHLTAYLYRSNGEHPGVVLLILHDISTIKLLEQNYLNFKKLTSLGRMTENIAREMRSPLLTISGFAEQMDQSLPQDSALRTYLAILRKELSLLDTILTQVEELASLPQPEYKKEDLVDLLQAVIDELRDLSREKNVNPELRISLKSQERTLYTDRPLIHKALKILLTTVIEILPPEAALSVYVHASEDYFVIDIYSTKTTFFSTEFGTILDSYFTSKPQVEKLNLITAHRIIEDQGGKIESFTSPQESVFYRVSLLKERRRKIRRQPV